ncbi:FAD binding domain-containing protein [Teichococcus oryzae]|uniref:Xanthine dehydrogenase family protein subunit M n=1 Tax=Teichococcus oryzae TaxID=1608942 RepID=A0A5B2TKI2_9PROT|nr:xanthine dehydrogenase family protein subunit M [Pseudoroseomonas oryzae]KAA2215007.1 xanthine dehydrogenase family protein subunit M [Pseudoroseomonas oryzae]
MYDFQYHKPATIADAVKLLAADPEARPVSGGMTLLPALKHRLNKPTSLIDLSGIAELRGVRREGDAIVIGGMTTHYEVATHPQILAAIPALARMAATIGDTQVRNRGTIGGSLANNDPAADYPAAALALRATIITDRRRIPADEFFLGMFTTALEADELVTGISFPIPEKAGYAKLRNPASRYSMTGVFVAKGPHGVGVGVNGAGPCAFRQAEMEAALSANWSVDAVANVKQSPDDLNSDIHGSAAYRANLVTVMAKRAVADAG